MPRYVILEHTGSLSYKPGVHWDLMLEHGDRLRTWELVAAPAPGIKRRARALADHRMEYLRYEGPVSGDRGEVRRWDTGEYEMTSQTANEISMRMNGQQLAGILNLTRDPAENDGWWATFDAQ
jgi:hypothetical protein